MLKVISPIMFLQRSKFLAAEHQEMRQDQALGPQAFAVPTPLAPPWVEVARIQAASLEPQLEIMCYGG